MERRSEDVYDDLYNTGTGSVALSMALVWLQEELHGTNRDVVFITRRRRKSPLAL